MEGQFEILLVNAQHIKAVPGRKTDQKDSEWIADLLVATDALGASGRAMLDAIIDGPMLEE